MRNRAMSIILALAVITPVSTVTAASKSPKLAKCDGKHRRSANPYGSILPTVDPLTGTSTPANQVSERAGVDVFPEKAPTSPKPVKPDGKTSPQVPPISSTNPPTSFQNC